MIRVLSAGLLFLLALSVPMAEAALVSYSDTSTGTPPQTTGYVDKGDLNLNKFDTSLGTLAKVTLTFTNYFDWQSFAENTSTSSGATFTHTINNQRVQITQGGTTFFTDSSSFLKSWSLGVYDNVLDFGGTSGITENNSSTLNTVSFTYTGASMAPFIGSGFSTFDVLSGADLFKLQGGGNMAMGSTDKFNAGASIIYEYAPVPIPAAAWLLGSGLVGLVGVRRRFRS